MHATRSEALASTGVLAVATMGLGFATYGLYTTGEKQISLVRDEFNATHRPKIIVHTFEAARDMHADGEAIGAHFTVVNKGTADATVEKIEGCIFMTDNLRPGVSFEGLGIPPFGLAAGEHRQDVAIFGEALDTAVIDMNSEPIPGRTSATLWCIGRIAYSDAARRRREMGFCRRYSVQRQAWVKEPESDYEYSY